MQTLRHAHRIACFVLVWFALSIGVAVASPMVKPQALQLVCSGAGALKVIASDTDGDTAQASPTLDCPLCAGLGNALPFDAVAFSLAAPRGHVLPADRSTRCFSTLSAAPPPARGPPHSV